METQLTHKDYSEFKIYYSDYVFSTFALNAGDALEAMQEEMEFEVLPEILSIKQETPKGWVNLDLKKRVINPNN